MADADLEAGSKAKGPVAKDRDLRTARSGKSMGIAVKIDKRQAKWEPIKKQDFNA
jgi:hypothetical protein